MSRRIGNLRPSQLHDLVSQRELAQYDYDHTIPIDATIVRACLTCERTLLSLEKATYADVIIVCSHAIEQPS